MRLLRIAGVVADVRTAVFFNLGGCYGSPGREIKNAGGCGVTDSRSF
ncbi:MAG: hypothetical protein ABI594_02945 [Ginsengibacter sp.]